jgi:hypothetical protein
MIGRLTDVTHVSRTFSVTFIVRDHIIYRWQRLATPAILSLYGDKPISAFSTGIGAVADRLENV